MYQTLSKVYDILSTTVLVEPNDVKIPSSSTTYMRQKNPHSRIPKNILGIMKKNNISQSDSQAYY